MGNNTRLHDGIVGALILTSTLLGFYVAPTWHWVTAIVALLMLQSTFTGFCPVYFVLGKLKS
jgi:hypothetical protein